MLLTSLLNALPGAVTQDLIWGLMAIGVYITYRILDVADLTVDGSLALGGAACVACVAVCPQKIAIPDELAAFAAELDKLPSWAEVCKARAEAERQEKASRGR